MFQILSEAQISYLLIKNMSEKEKQQENASDIFWLAKWLAGSFIWRIFIGIALLLAVNMLFGNLIWNTMENYFELEQSKLDKSITIVSEIKEFLKVDVMDKLDDIYERMDTAEEDIETNQEDIKSNQVDIKEIFERLEVVESTH